MDEMGGKKKKTTKLTSFLKVNQMLCENPYFFHVDCSQLCCDLSPIELFLRACIHAFVHSVDKCSVHKSVLHQTLKYKPE